MKIESVLKHKNKGYPVLDPSMDPQAMVRKMLKEDIPEAPVIYVNRLLGLLNRTSLFENVVFEKRLKNTVLTVIKKNIVVASPNDDVSAVLDQIKDDQIVIPILEDGRYINALHREDLMRELLWEKEDTILGFLSYINGFGVV